jgi:hypothetical protein
MRQDRFLSGILIGIAVLVVISIALFLFRRDQSEYLPDGTPQSAVQNYVLALQKGDTQRAFNYLADGNGKPDLVTFQQSILQQESEISSTSLEVGEVTLSSNAANISVTVIRSSGGLIAQISRQPSSATAVRSQNTWKISNLPYPFWAYNWYQPTPELPKPAPVNP